MSKLYVGERTGSLLVWPTGSDVMPPGMGAYIVLVTSLATRGLVFCPVAFISVSVIDDLSRATTHARTHVRNITRTVRYQRLSLCN